MIGGFRSLCPIRVDSTGSTLALDTTRARDVPADFRGTVAAFLCTVCSISVLSEIGAQQLAADLSYFHNVLSAVGGEVNFVVDDLRRALEMDLQAHLQHVEELRADHDNPEHQALAKMCSCHAETGPRPAPSTVFG
ncbi:hypothetical protein PF010_g26947 [Phytophthora fragariae]|uniref:Conserved oligomeric Golgi complex subunit 7 n=1 Tax=Phytophthora fragariae TaxID=53985 RepID=A0A6G0JV91_9STRA|nr:hypothetical protein PF010_g26947 [Phytophthora fragariae]